MQSRWNGRVKNASRTLPGFTTVLGFCVLGIGTALGLRLMTHNEYASTQVQTRTQIEKRPKCVDMVVLHANTVVLHTYIF